MHPLRKSQCSFASPYVARRGRVHKVLIQIWNLVWPIERCSLPLLWIPACAGMTMDVRGNGERCPRNDGKG